MYVMTDVNNVFLDYAADMWVEGEFIHSRKIGEDAVMYRNIYNIIKLDRVPANVFPLSHTCVVNPDTTLTWGDNPEWVAPEGYVPPVIKSQRRLQWDDINDFYDLFSEEKLVEFMESTDIRVRYFRYRCERYNKLIFTERNIASLNYLKDVGIMSQNIWDILFID